MKYADGGTELPPLLSCLFFLCLFAVVCAGVEHVKMGYYCRVCFLFYSNEDTAKKTHCSSKMHYEKLQVRNTSLYPMQVSEDSHPKLN